MKHGFERYCKDYENIENYQKAKKDNFKGWHCHHRLETHTSDGIRRPVDIPQKELKALGMYYHRPANELIFLTTREHNAYNRGKKCSDEAKKKNSEAHKGEKHSMYGKRHSEETKNKIAEAMKGKNTWSKGKRHSEETKNKMAESHKGKNLGNTAVKGKRWFNNGKINIRAKECPPGFIPGMLK